MAYTDVVFETDNINAGLAAEVRARLAGNFEVIKKDINADEVVGVKYFDYEDEAIKYAERFCMN